MHIRSQPFRWVEFDANEFMPQGWRSQITAFALSNYVSKDIVPTSVTSREASLDVVLPCQTVGGTRIRAGLPWLFDLYNGEFLRCARGLKEEPAFSARDDRYAINLNVQRGRKMRYECHVDSDPIEGLLYVTTHKNGAGGELVVSKWADALGPDEIANSGVRIFPEAGKLIFFDARAHPHFVTPLTSEEDIRIVVAMNYYTASCTEAERPADLNRHLGLV